MVFWTADCSWWARSSLSMTVAGWRRRQRRTGRCRYGFSFGFSAEGGEGRSPSCAGSSGSVEAEGEEIVGGEGGGDDMGGGGRYTQRKKPVKIELNYNCKIVIFFFLCIG